MRSELCREKVDELRHVGFYDGLVTDVRFLLPEGAPYWRAIVVTSVQVEHDGQWEWFFLTFEFEDAREFSIIHDYQDYGVNILNCGVNFIFLNDLIYIDFQSVRGRPEPTVTLEELRASPFYIAAKRVFWSMEPVPEE